MNDLTIKQLRELEGLGRNAHQTLEDIIRRIQPITYEPVIKEPVELEYMPLDISLD